MWLFALQCTSMYFMYPTLLLPRCRKLDAILFPLFLLPSDSGVGGGSSDSGRLVGNEVRIGDIGQ